MVTTWKGPVFKKVVSATLNVQLGTYVGEWLPTSPITNHYCLSISFPMGFNDTLKIKCFRSLSSKHREA